MEIDIVKVVGRNVRLFRTYKSWSQETLGELVGLDRTYIGALERGEINTGIRNLAKIASGLDMPVAALFQLTAAQMFTAPMREAQNSGHH